MIDAEHLLRQLEEVQEGLQRADGEFADVLVGDMEMLYFSNPGFAELEHVLRTLDDLIRDLRTEVLTGGIIARPQPA